MLFLILYLIFVITNIDAVNYNGYSVYRVETPNKITVDSLLSIVDKTSNVRVWHIDDISDIMISPENQQYFQQQLTNAHLNYTILINDVNQLQRKQKALFKTECSRSKRDCLLKLTFDQYYRFNDINRYLEDLVSVYPNFTSLIHIGKSFEGRDLNVIKISTGSKPGEQKPVIFIDGGIHAREWIAPAQVLYIIHQLTVNHTNNIQLIEDIDWYLLPVINPDGYEFTFDDDRYWRKTRSQYIIGRSPFCPGSDANRNWDFYFKADRYSSENCTDNYAGPYPFSEIEVVNVRNFVTRIKDNLKLYLSFHNYGTAFILPYGLKSLKKPDNYDEMLHLVENVLNVLRTRYRIGSPSRIYGYEASGQSVDWIKKNLNVPLTYIVELPGGGEGGFDLPEEDILSVVSDMFEGVRYMAQYVMNNYKH